MFDDVKIYAKNKHKREIGRMLFIDGKDVLYVSNYYGMTAVEVQQIQKDEGLKLRMLLEEERDLKIKEARDAVVLSEIKELADRTRNLLNSAYKIIEAELDGEGEDISKRQLSTALKFFGTENYPKMFGVEAMTKSLEEDSFKKRALLTSKIEQAEKENTKLKCSNQIPIHAEEEKINKEIEGNICGYQAP